MFASKILSETQKQCTNHRRNPINGRRHTRTVEANEAASAVKNNVPEIVRYRCNNNNSINGIGAEVNANNSKNAASGVNND